MGAGAKAHHILSMLWLEGQAAVALLGCFRPRDGAATPAHAMMLL
jgi:hypothetical protein